MKHKLYRTRRDDLGLGRYEFTFEIVGPDGKGTNNFIKITADHPHAFLTNREQTMEVIKDGGSRPVRQREHRRSANS